MSNQTVLDAAPLPRTRRRRLIAIPVVALLVAVAVWQGISAGSKSANNLVGPFGALATSFSLRSVQPGGMTLSLASFRHRPLVINFWASWCVPCRTEMPLLQAADRAGHHHVAFLGIDVNDSDPAARAFMVRVGVGYPVVADPNGTVSAEYGTPGLPTTVFVSADGKILGRRIGQLHAATLAAALQQAFGG